MGSKFVTVHVCDQTAVLKLLGAGDRAWMAALDVDDEVRAAIERLASRAYERDPESLTSDDAPLLIEAFEKVCARASRKSVTLEVYVDPDETKELWDFVWSEWSPPDVLELPLSDAGSPAVTFHDGSDLVAHRDALARVVERGDSNERFFPRDEQTRLLALLDEAHSHGLGVFVFYAE